MRTTSAEEVDKIITAWTSSKATAEAVEILIKHEVPCGPVRRILEVLRDQELAKRGAIVDLVHLDVGKVGDFKTWGFPIKFSEAATGFDAPAPKLGANNEEIYGRLLGLNLDQLAVLTVRIYIFTLRKVEKK